MSSVCEKCEAKLREMFKDMPIFKLMGEAEAEHIMQGVIQAVNGAHSAAIESVKLSVSDIHNQALEQARN